MRFCSPSVALCAPLTRPLFFAGVKRGVCSQINHFPEDADFDHDGAEYVLRKLTLQHCKKNLMNDKADGGRTLSHGPIRENPLLVKWSSIFHTQGPIPRLGPSSSLAWLEEEELVQLCHSTVIVQTMSMSMQPFLYMGDAIL